VIENFIPIGFRLQTRLTALIKAQLQKFWSLLAFCVVEVIYLGPRPFFFNVMLCEHHRQLNANMGNCYVIVVFFTLKVTACQHPDIALELGA